MRFVARRARGGRREVHETKRFSSPGTLGKMLLKPIADQPELLRRSFQPEPYTPATVNLPVTRRRTLQINGTMLVYPEGNIGPDKFLQATILTPQRPRPELWPFVPLMMVIDIVTLPFRILSEIGKFIVSPNKCYPLF